VVPLVAERVRVDKRTVERGRVRISKRVRRETVVVDEPLRRDDASVERVHVDRFVETPPEPRWDGDTFVLPIIEEVIVVTRRLRLVEELRIRRRTATVRKPRTVTVRREEALVERLAGQGESTTRRRGGSTAKE
jgi:uncharacterized protein (TIGR02271 family)